MGDGGVTHREGANFVDLRTTSWVDTIKGGRTQHRYKRWAYALARATSKAQSISMGTRLLQESVTDQKGLSNIPKKVRGEGGKSRLPSQLQQVSRRVVFTPITGRRDIKGGIAIEKACRFQGEANHFHGHNGPILWTYDVIGAKGVPCNDVCID